MKLTAGEATRALAEAVRAGASAAVALLVRSHAGAGEGLRMVAVDRAGAGGGTSDYGLAGQGTPTHGGASPSVVEAGASTPGGASKDGASSSGAATANASAPVGISAAGLPARPRREAGLELMGTLGSEELDRSTRRLLARVLAEGRGPSGERYPGVTTLPDADGGADLYIELHRPPPELVIVGAGHIAVPLARIGASIGFRVSVLDDRPEFATSERFPEAVRVLPVDFDHPFRDAPLHADSHLVLVTRGHRYDYACLAEALRAAPAPAYVGMIGSRRRVRATYLQLAEDGFSAESFGRIHAPVGLDIRAETPEEIAVAVAAELILGRRGGSGRPLSSVERIGERFFDAPKPE